MVIKKNIAWLFLVLGLMFILLAVGLCALSVGATKILSSDVLKFFTSPDITSVNYSILFNVRLPRIILGFAVGSALSLAGVILQGMFRNPLVEPYTLGISGGAALGVCLNIAFQINKTLGIISMPISGFLGSGLVIVFVYFLSYRKGVLKIQGLLLSGVMISFICSSLFMLIMAVMRVEDLHGIIFWTMGSLEQSSWLLIKIMVLISFIGLAVSYVFCKQLNAFSLGAEHAMHLGINTQRTQKILFLLTSLLTGASVSVAGIIGFVGLVMPHLVRLFTGGDHRILLICSYLAGGIFLIASDAIARSIISPLELPVGVITGIIGGTIFIYALNKKRGK
ncbi:MAG: iron ABC transporter permease [Candidatus Omnitrophica bacterium]|nr:iron ABC transporter permease [Candidatus Omnitrophota bacterium]